MAKRHSLHLDLDHVEPGGWDVEKGSVMGDVGHAPRRSPDRRSGAAASALLILAAALAAPTHAQGQEEMIVHLPTASPAAMRPGSPEDVVFGASLSGPLPPPEELLLLREDGSEVASLRDDGEAPDAEKGDYFYTGMLARDQFTVAGEGCEFFIAAMEVSESELIMSDSTRICFIGDDIPIGIPPLEPPESLEEIVGEDPSTRERFRMDEVLLKLQPGVSFDAAREVVGEVDGSIVGFLPLTGIFQVRVPGDGTVEGLRDVVDFLQSEAFEDTIEYVTPNHQLYHDQSRSRRPRLRQASSTDDEALGATAVAVPNDPQYSNQEIYLNRIKARQAWGRLATAQLQSADMAIFDTGFRAGNAQGRDFQGNLRHQRDCIDQDDRAQDTSTDGHGTEVASVAAAKWSNGHKIAGVAMNRQFVPVRIKRGSPGPAPARPDGFVINVICAFEYALSLSAPGSQRRSLPPIKVINASFGTFDDSVNATASGAVVTSLADVIRLAIDADIVVVASTTNIAFANEPRDYLPSPASHNLAIGNGLIVVGGSTANDRLMISPVESRRGGGVDLAAPGLNMRVINHQYRDRVNHGTSFSTALVTGAVALLRSRFPQLSARDVEGVIKGAAAVKPAVPGGRRLDIDRALRNAGG